MNRIRNVAIHSTGIAGAFSIFWGVFLTASKLNELTNVSVVSDLVYPGVSPNGAWWPSLFYTAMGLAGLGWWRKLIPWGGCFVAAYSIFLAFMAFGITDRIFAASTMNPDIKCSRAGCSPQRLQMILLNAPVCIGLGSLFLQSVFGRRFRHLDGWLLSPVLFVIADALQFVVWNAYVVPFLIRMQ